MWFKNLVMYRLVQPFALDAAAVSDKLAALPFQPVGKMERQSIGFDIPARHASSPLVHQVGSNLLVCLTLEEKILPAAVIRDEAEKKIAEIEQEQGRKVGKKERKEVMERVTDALLPQAFARRRKTFALIMPAAGLLVVNTASAKRAEELLELLRKCVDSLAVRPLATTTSPASAMTDWLIAGEAPEGLAMDNECQLQLPEDDGAMVRCVRQDVHADEVRNHLEAGKRVTKLALTWADRLSFVLTDDMIVRRIGFLDLLQDEAKSAGAVDADEQFDANLAIMAGEFGRFVPALIAAMGGEG